MEVLNWNTRQRSEDSSLCHGVNISLWISTACLHSENVERKRIHLFICWFIYICKYDLWDRKLTCKIQTLSKTLLFFLGYKLFSTAEEHGFYYTFKVFCREIFGSSLFLLKPHIFCCIVLPIICAPSLYKQVMHKSNCKTHAKRLAHSHE